MVQQHSIIAVYLIKLLLTFFLCFFMQATMAWESQDDGFIAKILLQEGAKEIPVGTPAMIFVEEQVNTSCLLLFCMLLDCAWLATMTLLT